MESLARVHHSHQPLHLSLNNHRPSFPKLSPSLSFRTSPRPLISVRAASSSDSTPKPLISPLIKTTCIAITAAALAFMRFNQNPAAAAATIPAPTSVSSSIADTTTDDVSFEEQERNLEQHLANDPNDVQALRSLMEVRIKSRKLVEAIEVIDRLIELEPEEPEWPLLRAQIHSYSGNFNLANDSFESILAKDPLKVEAYHGLVMSYSESGMQLTELEKRIVDAMGRSKKEKRKDTRDFKLLIAQIRVIEGKHTEALKLYQELVKEEPRDFRPYLCQGIIYTLLKNKDEAQKQFDKFRRLVPKNHPYREYFVDNMVATKLFAEKAERDMFGSKP